MPEFPSAQNPVRRMLVLLIQAALAPEDSLEPRWREKALRLQREVTDSRSLAARETHIDALWQSAIAEAETPDIVAEARQVSTTLPVKCPLTLAELVAPDFNLATAVQRVRNSAATG